MDSKQKIEERKRWNAPFLRAFNYLLEENYASTKGELCKMVGIEPGLISRYNNGTKKVSVDTINALARVSEGRLNVNYMLGKSEYMLLANVPDDEILNSNNPDREVIEERKKMEENNSSNLDPSSVINSLIANHTHQINRYEDDLKKKEIEMAERLAEKNARIAELKDAIAAKEEIIKARDARIVSLERQLAAATTGDLSRYPFTVGAAEYQDKSKM
jgi:transcriptional regulator with XRE-family HTH domain